VFNDVDDEADEEGMGLSIVDDIRILFNMEGRRVARKPAKVGGGDHPHFETVVIAIGPHATHSTRSVFSKGRTVLGMVAQADRSMAGITLAPHPSNGVPTCIMHRVEGATAVPFLLVECEYRVGAEDASRWARAVLSSISFDRMAVLTSGVRPTFPDWGLRAVHTPCPEGKRRVAVLEPSFALDDAAAMVVTLCHVRGIPCSAFALISSREPDNFTNTDPIFHPAYQELARWGFEVENPRASMETTRDDTTSAMYT